MIPTDILQEAIQQNIRQALLEDIHTGDISAELIANDTLAQAQILTRESMILAGQPWVNALIESFDKNIEILWLKNDGDNIEQNEVFLKLQGPAKSLLTIERSILNFIQTLSAVATKTYIYSKLLKNSKSKLIDTRKTVPGLRIALKYAVGIGGAENHRLGLYDAFLIKENHIIACGSILNAVKKARKIDPSLKVEVEVENFDELSQAINANVDIIMLDNFSLNDTATAVQFVNARCKIEASGGISVENLKALAETGVDYISMGDLTKNVKAIDLSMRFIAPAPI